LKGFLTPWIPINRVCSVLEKIGRGAGCKGIHRDRNEKKKIYRDGRDKKTFVSSNKKF